MRVTFELTLLGQTFHLGTHPEEHDDEPRSDVVTGTPASVEFGFQPVPDDYWTEERGGTDV